MNRKDLLLIHELPHLPHPDISTRVKQKRDVLSDPKLPCVPKSRPPPCRLELKSDHVRIFKVGVSEGMFKILTVPRTKREPPLSTWYGYAWDGEKRPGIS